MTPERWSALCEELSKLTARPALDNLIAAHRHEVISWPPELRSLPADSPWLTGVFDGRFDPRLELAGLARITQVLTRQTGSLAHGQMFDIVNALAAHLDPTFDAPDVVLAEENTIVSASGCGGGRATWTRGNATHSIRFTSNASESPSLGMLSDDTWTAVGLAPGCSLTIGSGDLRDERTFSASGPCPAVLELGPAWSAIAHGAELSQVRRVLAQTRVPWR